MKLSKLILLSIPSCLILIAISLSYTNKTNYAPDEWNHLHVVNYYSTNAVLPTWKDFRYGTTRGHAYHLFSPLGYLPYLPVALVANYLDITPELDSGRDRRHFVRHGGVIFSILQYALTLAICVLIFGRTAEALLGTLAINLIPQLRYIHGYINADAPSILIGTFAFYTLLKILIAKKISLRLSALVGITLAIILLGKYHIFHIGAFLGGVYCLQLIRLPIEGSRRIRHLGLIVAPPLLLGAWFHFYIVHEIASGAIHPITEHKHLFVSTFSGSVPEGRFEIDYDRLWRFRLSETSFVWKTFWGWMVRSAELPWWYLYILTVPCGVGVFGWLAYFLRRNRSDSSPGLSKNVFWALLSGPLLMFVAFCCLAINPDLKIQGRLLLPQIVATMLFLIYGIAHLVTFLRKQKYPNTTAVSGFFVVIFLIGNGLLLL